MRLLAIDPGTHLGWATDASGRLEYGEIDFSLARGESPGMRFIRFRRWLEEIVDFGGRPGIDRARDRVGLVIFEMPHLRGGAATDILVGMTTRIQEFCAEQGIEHASVHSTTLKKFALGKGRGDKAAMIEAAVKRLEATPVPAWFARDSLSEHEADALWLFWYAQEKYSGGAQPPERPTQSP